jgi:hypothetical protein
MMMMMMRELAQILSLRETLWSRLLRELQYLLHPILVGGLAVMHVGILLLHGFVVLMESWNVLISVSLSGKSYGKTQQIIYICSNIWYTTNPSLCSENVREKEETKIQTN